MRQPPAIHCRTNPQERAEYQAAHEQRAVLAAALRGCERHDRELLLLTYASGLTVAEACRAMSPCPRRGRPLSVREASSRLRALRTRLRRELKKAT